MEEKFLQQLKETLEVKDRELQLADNFRQYEEWDSLNLLSVIALIDEEYGVVIDGNDFAKLNTVADLVDEIKKRLPNK